MRSIPTRIAPLVALLLWAPLAAVAQAKSLPEQIADVMVQLNGGVHPGFRFAHAKGLVLTGTFTPAPSARAISKAAHLTGGPVPVTVRLSDATGLPEVSDANPNASPRGMAIRFTLTRTALPTSSPTRTTGSSSAPATISLRSSRPSPRPRPAPTRARSNSFSARTPARRR